MAFLSSPYREIEFTRFRSKVRAVSWQAYDAKQRFSELVQRAIDEGPQVVTRRGKDAVVVVAADEYRRLIGGVPDFKAFLLTAPDLSQLGVDSELRDLPRETDF